MRATMTPLGYYRASVNLRLYRTADGRNVIVVEEDGSAIQFDAEEFAGRRAAIMEQLVARLNAICDRVLARRTDD